MSLDTEDRLPFPGSLHIQRADGVGTDTSGRSG